MKTQTKQTQLANGLIILSILARLLPHPANVTPVGAVSLVGGAKLSRIWKWTIPFIALLLSDFLLGIFFHLRPWSFVTPFIYASFAINILLGSRVGGSHRYLKLGALSLVGSLQFFCISNFGVWMEGTLYAKTFAGLAQCYTMAIPFLGNTMMGDLCWAAGLFTLIEWIQLWIQSPKTESPKTLSA